MTNKLLLHICCGPCATPIIPNLNKDFEVEGLFYNPNIFPQSEFDARLKSAKKVTEFNGVNLMVMEESSCVIPTPPLERVNSAEGSLNTEGKGFLRSPLRGVGRNDNGYAGYIQFIGAIKKKPERCLLCYRQRLEKTAEYAKANGFDCFSTTLLISPFQYHDDLKHVGEEVGREVGVDFYYKDFRPLYKESRELARAMDLYLQKYCGCKFSRKRK